ncbi:Uncharacterized protein DAT39_005719 [Clarias magur]|uniref:Uncharacterized protein n=1 Tax=Clarias magur TaxID=1594786 RepID=A0A8J4X7I4_CLAMG|nr:Uncharacterized protein DAT39_005719 [Clarias magur]
MEEVLKREVLATGWEDRDLTLTLVCAPMTVFVSLSYYFVAKQNTSRVLVAVSSRYF